MDRTAVFVDAGYLFAEGARLITGEKLARGELHLDYDAVLGLLADLARAITGLPLLRLYWYDGATAGPTPQQLALAYRPSVKLRLGFVNEQGQQEGVDSLLVTDLIHLARNRAMADALLLTGDEDIRVGVQQAQEYGVRVHLLGIEPARENQSGLLAQEADSIRELTRSEVQSFLKRAQQASSALAPASSAPQAAAVAQSESPGSLEEMARRIAAELLPEQMHAFLEDSLGGSIPAPIDARLLVAGTRATDGGPLTAEQKRRLRAAFLAHCRKFTRA